MVICLLVTSGMYSISVTASEATNVAEGKQAYASPYIDGYGSNLGHITDGKANPWSSKFFSVQRSDTRSHWVAIDLAGAYEVNKVVVYTQDNQGMPTEFGLVVYDGKEWIEVHHGYGDGTSNYASGFSFSFQPIVCNAVKLIAYEPSADTNGTYCLSLCEMKVWGVPAYVTLETPSFEDHTTNVALKSSGTIPSTSHPNSWSTDPNTGYTVDRVNDGNSPATGTHLATTTSAEFQNEQITVTLQFAGANRINKVTLHPSFHTYTSSATQYKGGFPEDFRIEVFTDKGWEPVISRTGFEVESSYGGMPYYFYFADVDCTAVQLVCTKNGELLNSDGTGNGSYGLYLQEFSAYGTSSDKAIPFAPETYSSVQTVGTAFAATSYESGDVSLAKLNDGKHGVGWWKAFYTSDFFANAESGQYTGVMFDEAYWFKSVTLCYNDSKLPQEFHVSVYNGSEWENVEAGEGVANYPFPSDNYVEMTYEFDEICGSAIKVTGDVLSVCDNGNQTYALAMEEMIISGAKAGIVLEKPAVSLFNISNGMTVTAGNVIDWTASGFSPDLNNLVDGDSATRYSSNWLKQPDNCEWVQVTFDAPFKATYIAFNVWKDGTTQRFPKDFKIQAYNGAEWETVVEQTDYTKSSYRFGFTPIDCTAMRLVATELDAADTAYALTLADMNIYGENADAQISFPPAELIRENRAAASVALSLGAAPELLIDSDYSSPSKYCTSTLVENATDSVQLHFMFEKTMYVDRMRFYVQNEGEFPTDFDVYAYTSEGWQLADSIKDYPTETGSYHEISFDGVYCNSIIVVATGLPQIDDGYGWQLREVYINSAFAEGESALLGDGNGDNVLDATDISILRGELVEDVNSGMRFDFNMDSMKDVRDLIRFKRYFALKK